MRVLDSRTGATVWSTAEPAEQETCAIDGGTVDVETNGALAAQGLRGSYVRTVVVRADLARLRRVRIVAAGDLVHVASFEGDGTRPRVGTTAP